MFSSRMCPDMIFFCVSLTGGGGGGGLVGDRDPPRAASCASEQPLFWSTVAPAGVPSHWSSPSHTPSPSESSEQPYLSTTQPSGVFVQLSTRSYTPSLS